jgi:diguanylate cyclase (GGDEF)-like protein/PAS domain S-box-containing protein
MPKRNSPKQPSSAAVASPLTPLRDLREWIRDEDGAILRAASACFVGYLVWMVVVPASPTHRFISELYNSLVPMAAALSAWRTSQHAALHQHTRQAWFACAVGLFALAVGDGIWFVDDYVIGHRPTASLADGLCLSSYPLLFWGLLRFPGPRRSRRDLLKLSLDISMVVVTGGGIIWYLIIDPHLGAGTSTMLGRVLSTAYPVGDLVLLFVSAVVLLYNPASVSRRALQMIALASLAMFGSDLVLGYDVVHTGVYHMGRWTDLGWQSAMLLWILAAFQQRWRATHPANDGSTKQETRFAVGVVPYTAILMGYTLLVLVAWSYWEALGAWIGPVLLLATLVFARQIIAVHENVRLVTEHVVQETRFRSLVQNSSDVITVVDERGKIQFMSPAVERVFGWLPDESVGMHITDIVHRDDAAAVSAFMESLHVQDGATAPRPLILRCRNKAGEWRSIETIAMVLADDPVIRGIVLNTRDVSERMALQAELAYQAYHDSLTQLANRSWFHTRVENALEHFQSAPDQVAVLFLDLDNFKNINDSLGHAAGDMILIEVAQRLLNATRGSDMVARLGGDEFAVLVNRITSDADLVVIADRIITAMHAPFALRSSDVVSSASIGIARGHPGQTADDLLRNADVAMYVSKRQGKGSYTLFEPQMHTRARERLGLEIDLRHALMRDELTLVFQPIVTLADRRLLGVEALVRWMHPHRGLLMPGEFIPMAEEAGLILPLGRWVLQEACRQGARWHSMYPASAPFTVALNVSGRQLEQVTFIDEVATALQDTGFSPGNLLLEVTESVIAHDVAATLQQLKALKRLGIRLAIDDFGTGYSSLSVLQQFPVDVLKIDKSFINDAMSGEQGLAVAQTIVALANALSLQTVAEGIEHWQQADVLSAMGCGFAQGFYFSRPVQSAEIDALIHQGAMIGPTAPSDGLL